MDDTNQNPNQELEDERACPEICKDAEPGKAILKTEEVVSPQVGMIFDSLSEVKSFYKRYASRYGFKVITRTSKNNGDGINRYFTFSCARSGKTRRTSQNPMLPHPTNKTDCKAKINVKVLNDGRLFLTSAFLDHNHELNVRKLMCLNKRLDTWETRRNDQAGNAECLNEGRRLILNVGEWESLNSYFVRMQNQDSKFFYVMDVNEDSCVRSVFWADAKSRALYDSFGDVIAFDTTYVTSKFELPLVTFVGVNHHGRTILLGCGLLCNEEENTYAWLFRSFLACMAGISPKAVVTDEGKEIQDAVAEVFPEAKHRLCLSQILQRLPLILGTLPQYREIKKTFKNIVFESLTVDEFEESWAKFIVGYNLDGYEWLRSLYFDRKFWVPVFVKETFWAGLSITERNEKTNAFFDGFVDSQMSLTQFLELYDDAMKSKVEKEQRADFASSTSVVPLLTHFPIERQFQQAYTNEMFKKIQEELRGLMYCNSMLVKTEGTLCTYQVTDHVEKKDGSREIVTFDVLYAKDESDIRCLCHSFEFRGIICRHIIAILVYQDKKEVPPCYILPRWRKDIKRKHVFIRSSYDNSENAYEFVMKILVELKEKMLKGELSCSDDELHKKEQSMRKNEKTDKVEKKKHVEEGSCSRQLKKKKVSQTSTISVQRSDARLNNLPPMTSNLPQAYHVPFMLPGNYQMQPLAFSSPPQGYPGLESNGSINSGPGSDCSDFTR